MMTLTQHRNQFRSMLIAAAAIAVFTLARPAAAGLIAHYSFDNDYTDSSGNGNNATPTDGNGDMSTSGVSITHTAGEYMFGGGAANFSTDYLSIPTQTFGSGSPYSISFWARDLSSTSNSNGMVIGDPSNTGFFIWIDQAPGGLRWRSVDGTSARQADFSFAYSSDWHQYAIVASDYNNDASVNDITLYRDGAFFGTATGKLTGFIAAAIGQAYNASKYNFDGQIDEVYILNQALTGAQVHSLYEINAVPTPAALPAGAAALGLLALRRRRR